MIDAALVAALACTFAAWVTLHVALAWALARRGPAWRGGVALVVPPLAPYWAHERGMRGRAHAWLALAAAVGGKFVACMLAARAHGESWKDSAAIGTLMNARGLMELILLNIGGAKPGDMDRATQGSPAKYSYCFGENEEESPWEPYHVRKGFAATDSVVTTMAAEAPHNINDHASKLNRRLFSSMDYVVIGRR